MKIRSNAKIVKIFRLIESALLFVAVKVIIFAYLKRDEQFQTNRNKGARVNNLKNVDVTIPEIRLPLLPDFRVRANRRWHSIRCMPKGSGVM